MLVCIDGLAMVAILRVRSTSTNVRSRLDLLSPVSTMSSKKPNKADVVQVKNPRSGRYVKIDRSQGKILDHKKSEGPYKNVPIARKKSSS